MNESAGKMAEWSNAPDLKSGVQVLLYRGFESLSFRQYFNEYEHFGAFFISTHTSTHMTLFFWL